MTGPQFKSVPAGALLVTLLLGAYYLIGLRPLARKAQDLDHPLQDQWKQLVATNRASVACQGLDLAGYSGRLTNLQARAKQLDQLRALVDQRIQPSPSLSNLLSQPFTLYQFQNASQQRSEQLSQTAHKNGVQLAPAALAGLPQYSDNDPEPNYLWARLEHSTALLECALGAKVEAVRSLAQLPSVRYRLLGEHTFLEELPVRLEVLGDMTSLSRLLTSLPLRGQELTAAGLPALTNKPAFFLSRILLRKASAQHPNEVLAEMRISTFVPTSQAWHQEGAP